MDELTIIQTSDNVDFHQFHEPSNQRIPEIELMVAVWNQAIDDYNGTVTAGNVYKWNLRKKPLHEEAKAWFMSDDDTHLFAFENICMFLNLDASAMRRGILK